MQAELLQFGLQIREKCIPSCPSFPIDPKDIWHQRVRVLTVQFTFQIEKGVLVPGVVFPVDGSAHAGYDHLEVARNTYEVLCRNQPCSLMYLAGRCVRQRIREKEKWINARQEEDW